MTDARQPACLATLALAAITANGAAQDRRARESEPPRDPASIELKHFRAKRIEFDAKSYKPARGKASYMVYLPADYDAEINRSRRYPWAIWLHGMNGSHARFHFGGGARVLDRMREREAIPEMIFVALSAAPQTLYWNGELAGEMENYVRKDVVAHLAENYRVAADRSKRALMGVSMGGTGALKIAFKHPEEWGIVAVHSSAILPADPDTLPRDYVDQSLGFIRRSGLSLLFEGGIDKKHWRAETPMALVQDGEVAKLNTIAIYFDAGDLDSYGFGPWNERLHRFMKHRGIEHQFEFVEGGGHAWASGSVQVQLEKSLRFVAAEFAMPRHSAPTRSPPGDGKVRR